ncbi:hypothetical protein [Nitrospira defluvii]|uniref:Secreted protein n=1 Tax=Nitrospira defluvii TaxID=330214 RepID=A0ABM8SC61_9BACT|nr:hypothetical protein [Nitrospira defluvii]CAE6800666.1 hypothetical protein NSPZN2_80047 [Nitrospira defluvii]
MSIPTLMIRLCFVLAYLVLALPLPLVLLDHQLGLLMGNPAHTTLDDHAWLDHAAGAGEVSGGSASCVAEVFAPTSDSSQVLSASFEVSLPSVRGPPPPIRSRAEYLSRGGPA